MVVAIIGIILACVLGGYAPQSKWPKAELLAYCVLAFVLVMVALLWKQHTQGACLQPSPALSNGSAGVCSNIFTFKNILIGWVPFAAGVTVGLAYRLIPTIVTKRRNTKK